MPQAIAENKFIGASGRAANQVAAFYTNFERVFNHELPDERGLTDMFLLSMSIDIRESGLADPAFQAKQISQYQEGKLGYDYSWTFQVKRTNAGIENYLCLLQAKNFKNGVANFLYKNSKGEFQIDILKKEYDAQKAANPGVIVRGGYILYGPKTVQFVDIDTVIKYRNETATDQYISGKIYPSLEYFIADILIPH